MTSRYRYRGSTAKGELAEGMLLNENGDYAVLLTSENTAKVVDVESLEQSTGLLDKNKKEIFEGDILKYDGTIYKIYYDKERAEYLLRNLDEPNTRPESLEGTSPRTREIVL